jgi:hypothetical protein
MLSPLILGRGGDLRVLGTRFRGDVRVDKSLSHLYHLRIQLKKLNMNVPERHHLEDGALKWQLNLKLRWSLKDPHPEDGNPIASRV